MSTNWLTALIRCRYEPRFLPYLLALTRLLICFLPQTGYLHPDEFFQSTDISGGKHFGSKIEPVWEFTTDKPIRCMLIPNLLNKIAFTLAGLIQSKPSAYMLIVAPRFIYTLLSFVVDWSLVKLCQYYSTRGLWYLPVSVVFQTSFICLGCLTRTLSNVPETVIFAVLLVVICQTLRPAFRILFVAQNRTVPINQRAKKSHQILSSILVGLLITIGIFNRPTFPCFAVVPLLYWLVESWKRNLCRSILFLQRVVIPIAVTTTLTALLISAYDTHYYRGDRVFEHLFISLTREGLESFWTKFKSNWILTPYNFIAFNTNSQNLNQFGLHPPYMHMLINLPLAFNLLALMFYGKLLTLFTGSNVYRLIFTTHRVYALMLLTTLVSVISLSFIPHQEFRFLLPVIIPLTYAFAFNIYSSNRLLAFWIMSNLVLTLFYSHFHQAGVTRACLYLDNILKMQTESDIMQQQVGVVALKAYRMPSYQWNIPNSADWFRFIASDNESSIDTTVESTIQLMTANASGQAGTHDIYFMLHKLFEDSLIDNIVQRLPTNCTHKIEVVKSFWPHFSGEEFSGGVRCIRREGWRCVKRAFDFSLIHLSLNFTNINNFS